MKIGIDLDGVLYDFCAAFREYLIERHDFNPARCTPPQRWDFYHDWGLTDWEFSDLCHHGADAHALWCRSGPWGGRPVLDALADIRADGHTVHIITRREFGSHKAVSALDTALWLQQHNVPYDTLTFAADKTLLRTDWMLEDNIDNYLQLKDAGCRAVLMDRPWNRDLADALRVSSVEAFCSLVGHLA